MDGYEAFIVFYSDASRLGSRTELEVLARLHRLIESAQPAKRLRTQYEVATIHVRLGTPSHRLKPRSFYPAPVGTDGIPCSPDFVRIAAVPAPKSFARSIGPLWCQYHIGIQEQQHSAARGSSTSIPYSTHPTLHQ
jgi:hypothetical protein